MTSSPPHRLFPHVDSSIGGGADQVAVGSPDSCQIRDRRRVVKGATLGAAVDAVFYHGLGYLSRVADLLDDAGAVDYATPAQRSKKFKKKDFSMKI